MYEKILIIFLVINLPLVFFFEPITKKINLFDHGDNKRKFQKKPVALIGGILIVYNIFFFNIIDFFFIKEITKNLNFTSNREYFSLFFGLISFFIIGLYDDKYNLSANKKLSIIFFLLLFLILIDENLLITKLYFSFFSNDIELNKFSYFFTILSILLFLNALNMFDGINLQVGFYSLTIFLIFISKNIFPIYTFIFILTISYFLILNFQNKGFLGDNGTLVLGFVISYFLIKSHNLNASFTPEEIFVILSIPGLDMLRLFIYRLLDGKNPFTSDINHIHHLISRRYNNIIAFLIIQGLIVFNGTLFYYIDEKLIVLLLNISSYILIFLIFKKECIKNLEDYQR